MFCIIVWDSYAVSLITKQLVLSNRSNWYNVYFCQAQSSSSEKKTIYSRNINIYYKKWKKWTDIIGVIYTYSIPDDNNYDISLQSFWCHRKNLNYPIAAWYRQVQQNLEKKHVQNAHLNMMASTDFQESKKKYEVKGTDSSQSRSNMERGFEFTGKPL